MTPEGAGLHADDSASSRGWTGRRQTGERLGVRKKRSR